MIRMFFPHPYPYHFCRVRSQAAKGTSRSGRSGASSLLAMIAGRYSGIKVPMGSGACSSQATRMMIQPRRKTLTSRRQVARRSGMGIRTVLVERQPGVSWNATMPSCAWIRRYRSACSTAMGPAAPAPRGSRDDAPENTLPSPPEELRRCHNTGRQGGSKIT